MLINVLQQPFLSLCRRMSFKAAAKNYIIWVDLEVSSIFMIPENRQV